MNDISKKQRFMRFESLMLTDNEFEFFELLEFLTEQSFATYIYTNPLLLDGDLSNYEFYSDDDYRWISEIDTKALDRLPLSFYRLTEKASRLIYMNTINTFGLVKQDLDFDSGKWVDLEFSPLVNLLDSECDGSKILLCDKKHYISDLFITLEDANSIKEKNLFKFRNQEIPPLASINKVKEINQDKHTYEETTAGDNLRKTHELTIDFLLSLLETDAKNGYINRNSEFAKYFTEENKFILKPLASDLEREANVYFEGARGFGDEVIRKRIQAIRKQFK